MGFAVHMYVRYVDELVGSQLGTMHTAHELNYVDRKQVYILIKVYYVFVTV